MRRLESRATMRLRNGIRTCSHLLRAIQPDNLLLIRSRIRINIQTIPDATVELKIYSAALADTSSSGVEGGGTKGGG